MRGIRRAASPKAPSKFANALTLAVSRSGSYWALLGHVPGREVQDALTLLDSRPACKEGSCMDPTRLPHAPYAPRFGDGVRQEPSMQRRTFMALVSGGLL